MAMSNAERQRKFRRNRNMDPERQEEYLQKEKERNRSKLERGKVKDMTAREKRAVRKYWKIHQQKSREKKT